MAGEIASYEDCWKFRKTIAKWLGISVRTVQRAITELKSLGLLGVARLKKGERPHGAEGPITCGGSHRWTIGRGKAPEIIKRMIDAARLKYISRAALSATFARKREPAPKPSAVSTPAPAFVQRPLRREPLTHEQLRAEFEAMAERVTAARAREGPD